MKEGKVERLCDGGSLLFAISRQSETRPSASTRGRGVYFPEFHPTPGGWSRRRRRSRGRQAGQDYKEAGRARVGQSGSSAGVDSVLHESEQSNSFEENTQLISGQISPEM